MPVGIVIPRLADADAPVGIRSVKRSGGARRDRTDDILLAKQALSQLSYGPVLVVATWRRRADSSSRISLHVQRRLPAIPKDGGEGGGPGKI
jgi:hypothetical protein